MSSPTFPLSLSLSLSPMSRLPISLFLSLSLSLSRPLTHHVVSYASPSLHILTHLIVLSRSSLMHNLALLCLDLPTLPYASSFFWLTTFASVFSSSMFITITWPCRLSHALPSSLTLLSVSYATLTFYAFPVHLTLMVRTFTTSTRRTRHRRPRRSIGMTTIGGPSSSSTTGPPNGTRLRWLYTSSSSICFAGWFIMSSPSILMACLI